MIKCLKIFKTEISRPVSQADARASCFHALSFVPATSPDNSFSDMMRARAICMAIYAGALDHGLEKAIGISDNNWIEVMGKPLADYVSEVDFSRDPSFAPSARPRALRRSGQGIERATALAGGPNSQ